MFTTAAGDPGRDDDQGAIGDAAAVNAFVVVSLPAISK
jgi:hypothetical protein